MNNKKIKILALFYSFTKNVADLARYVGEGASSINNTEVIIKQVPETLSEVFFNNNPKIKISREELNKEFSIAIIDDLINADAVAFGTPTHFGSFASQVKQFIDQLTLAWLQGKLINKPVAVFCACGSTHGGEELTLLSLMIPLAILVVIAGI